MDVGPYFSIQSIITIILLMFLNSLIIAVHTGLISLNSEKLRELEEEGNSKAKYLLKITSDQDSLNQAFAMVDMVLSFFIVSYLVRRVRVIVENSDILNGSLNASAYIIIGIIIFSMIRLIFIDKIPKRLAVRNPMGIAMATNFLTRIIMAITYPFVKFTNAVTNLFMNIFGIEAKAIEKEVTSEQIKSIVQVGENQGIIRPMESRMIHSIMGFDDLIAEEIMTARTDVFMIDVNDSEKTWLDEFTKIRHSRIPVYEDEVDNILGIIYTKDYLLEATRVGIKNVHLRSLIKPAYFVPDKIETDKLFADMQIKHIHMAILIDEYGGFAGVVTIDDLLEEIVGDLNEGEDCGVEFRENRKGVYVVKASISIKDLNEKIPIEIDEDNENYDSLGGFIIDKLGYIPEAGENESLDYNGYEIKILYIEDNRIKACRIRKLKEDK
ncbi:hemolysin family protein [Anaerococcus sp. Marseille-P3625]|uniref:hemolysin family protein n=1 Tax=Anaerococcus sp. Marseille-P3625 TaxID=1977277 RepID=UPI000C06BD88|nr:hemolysin family protein [Anaerococcus sp. Marseille-P3625]